MKGCGHGTAETSATASGEAVRREALPREEDPAISGRRMVRISYCPGYTGVGGNFGPGCHPDEEPGGYDVMLGMMLLNPRPLTLADAFELARGVAFWVGRAIDYDRRGVTAAQAGEPLAEAENITEDTYSHLQDKPGATQIPILRALAANTGRLVARDQSVSKPGPFMVEDTEDPRGQRQRSVRWSEVLWLERAGYALRDPGSNRFTGARILTDHGRKAVA